MFKPVNTPKRATYKGPAARPLDKKLRRQFAHGQREGLPFDWRYVSAAFCLILLATGTFIFASPRFYVQRVEVAGAGSIPPEEIYAEAGIANTHILWVVPDEVKDRLLESPSITHARVLVGWPARVIIIVEERQPEMVWIQDGEPYWVDASGILMPQRLEDLSLLRITNTGEGIPFHCPGPSCPIEEPSFISLDPLVINGARIIKVMRPDLTEIQYSANRGLSFTDSRGWSAVIGQGNDIERKMQVYESLITSLTGSGIIPSSIDVSDPENPVYDR